MTFYHDGSRLLQARFGSTALADRLEEKLHRTAFTDSDKAFIEGASFFFLATADAGGRPDCSFKGGAPGIVRVAAPELLVFPDYDVQRHVPQPWQYQRQSVDPACCSSPWARRRSACA